MALPYYIEDSPHNGGHTGAFVLNVCNPAGTVVATAGDYCPFTADTTGRLRVLISGTGTGQYAEDSVMSNSDIGTFILAVRNSALATLTSSDGDFSAIAVDEKGRVLVSVSDTGSGTDVTSYTTETVANSASSSTLTYTCVNTTFFLKSIIASASSGPCKVEVLMNSVVKAVAFFSSANPTVQINFDPQPTITTGQIAEIRVTNSSGNSMDCYGTLMGQDQ